jgi:hypothetical protein
MSPTRPLLAALLAGALLAVAGCGDPEEGEPIREGLAHELGGLDYNVFITRQLNLSLPEDEAYYDGPPAPAGSALYGVFIEVCNRGDEPAEAVDDFHVTDTQGAEFEPVELPEENVFAYRPKVLQPEECIPARGSVPQLGPTGGAMLLFQLPQEATENRPLELEIADEAGESIEVELDI